MKDDYKMFERSIIFQVGFYFVTIALFTASALFVCMIFSLFVDIGHWARTLIF